mgnify:CR=1 FL=1
MTTKKDIKPENPHSKAAKKAETAGATRQSADTSHRFRKSAAFKGKGF